MNYDKIHDHVEHIISQDSNQIPNLQSKEMAFIVENLMQTIKSMDKLDRLSIRRTCWEAFQDSNSRQIIDLCFPAQIGPLCVWPPSKKSLNGKTDIRSSIAPSHVHVEPVSKVAKAHSPMKDQSSRSDALDIGSKQYSNNEIMAKLDLVSEKIDNISNLLQQFIGNKDNLKREVDD
jgi:hypothetical protein